MNDVEHRPDDMENRGPQSQKPPLWAPWYGIGFGQAIVRFFRKAFVFHGRASRGEYWWIWLFTVLVVLAVGALAGGVAALLGMRFDIDANLEDSPVGMVIDQATTIAQLVLCIPSLSLSVRRLHDENRRGWWVLLPIVMMVGAFVALLAVLIAGDVLSGTVDRDDYTAQTVVVAMLVFFGMYLLSMLSSVILMVGPSDPRGARFDRPGGAAPRNETR